MPLDRNVDPDVDRDGDGGWKRGQNGFWVPGGERSSEEERGLVFSFSKMFSLLWGGEWGVAEICTNKHTTLRRCRKPRHSILTLLQVLMLHPTDLCSLVLLGTSCHSGEGGDSCLCLSNWERNVTFSPLACRVSIFPELHKHPAFQAP